MFAIVLITCPPEKAEKIAQTLLEKHVTACVNVIPKISSFYWWKNQINSDQEALLIVKTRFDILHDLKKYVKKVHPYDVPEIIALPIVTGSLEYLQWINKALQTS